MTSVLVQTVGTATRLQFRVNAEPVRLVLAGMPKVAYFWIRDFLGRSLVRHRVSWLASKVTRFGRASGSGKGIRVPQVNEASGPLHPQEVRYTVEPAERRMPTSKQARAGLEVMRAEVATGNLILQLHQFGGDIRSARPMFLPTRGTRPGDFQEWRRANPDKQLRFLPSKRGDGKTLVYELQHKARIRSLNRSQAAALGGRLAPAPTGTGTLRWQKLKLRWVLTTHVRMRPTLRLYESWEQLANERDKAWSQAADKMIADLRRADPRDL